MNLGVQQPALFLNSLLTARNEYTKRDYKCCDKSSLALLARASQVSTSWRAAAESCWTKECLREYPWLQKIHADRPGAASISSLYSRRARCRFNPYHGWGGFFNEVAATAQPGDQERLHASGYELVCEMHAYQGNEEEGYGDIDWDMSTEESISVFKSAQSRNDWVGQAAVLQSMWGCNVHPTSWSDPEAAAKKRLIAELEEIPVEQPIWSTMPLGFKVGDQEISMSGGRSGYGHQEWNMSSRISASTTYELNPDLNEYEQYDDYQQRASFSCGLSYKYDGMTPQMALVLYIVRKCDNEIFCLGRKEIDHMKKLSPCGEGPYQSCVMGHGVPLTTKVSFDDSGEGLEGSESIQVGGVDFAVKLNYHCLDGCGFIVVNMDAVQVLVNVTASCLVSVKVPLFQLLSSGTGSTSME